MIRFGSLVIVFLLLSMPFIAGAQVMGQKIPFAGLGVKIGGSMQALSGAPVRSGPGVVAGLYSRKNIGRFGVRVEALASTAHYTTKYPASIYSLYSPGMDTISKGDFQVIYASIPLMIDYQLNKSMQLLAGAQWSYVVSLYEKNNAFSNIYGTNNFIKPTDFSLVAGLELSVAKKVRLGLRFIKGVTDVNKSTYYLVPKTWTTTGVQATVSYKIF